MQQEALTLETPVQLIVGLGNPGAKYAHTRHNAGADFVAELARQHSAPLKEESKFFGATGKAQVDGKVIRLLIPSTFMNVSGKSVSAIANFYNIPASAILVAHDELDIDPGIAKLKIGGGHGGHNGLRDIIQCLGNNREFVRLRIGIGHPGHASQVTNYVLSKASPVDQSCIEESIDKAIMALPLAVEGKWQQAMTELHSQY